MRIVYPACRRHVALSCNVTTFQRRARRRTARHCAPSMEKRIPTPPLPNQPKKPPMTPPVSDGLASLLARNRAYIPGGVSSTNRIIDPPISFSKGQGAYLWDIDGKRYVDYHAAFAPHFLGHNFAPINDAVVDSLRSGASLFGAGPSQLEGRLAVLLCKNVAAGAH